MSFGKMKNFVDIIKKEQTLDSEGFATEIATVVAQTRAFMENKQSNMVSKNEGYFGEATFNLLLRAFIFRKIPNFEVTTSHSIVCEGKEYCILRVVDVANRKMYTEVLTEAVEASER